MKKKAIFTVFCSNTPASYFPWSSNIEAFPMLLEALHPMSRVACEPLCGVEKGTGCLCLFVFTCQIVVSGTERCFPTSLLLSLLYSGFFSVIFTQTYKLFGTPQSRPKGRSERGKPMLRQLAIAQDTKLCAGRPTWVNWVCSPRGESNTTNTVFVYAFKFKTYGSFSRHL